MVDWTRFDDKELKIKMIIDHKEDYADDSEEKPEAEEPQGRGRWIVNVS